MTTRAASEIVIGPVITERTYQLYTQGRYTFRVAPHASKTDIKKAVELMFEVKVAGVQVVNEPGKTRRFAKTHGRTQDWKKAYVSLISGQTIDYEARAKA